MELARPPCLRRRSQTDVSEPVLLPVFSNARAELIKYKVQGSTAASRKEALAEVTTQLDEIFEHIVPELRVFKDKMFLPDATPSEAMKVRGALSIRRSSAAITRTLLHSCGLASRFWKRHHPRKCVFASCQPAAALRLKCKVVGRGEARLIVC